MGRGRQEVMMNAAPTPAPPGPKMLVTALPLVLIREDLENKWEPQYEMQTHLLVVLRHDGARASARQRT